MLSWIRYFDMHTQLALSVVKKWVIKSRLAVGILNWIRNLFATPPPPTTKHTTAATYVHYYSSVCINIFPLYTPIHATMLSMSRCVCDSLKSYRLKYKSDRSQFQYTFPHSGDAPWYISHRHSSLVGPIFMHMKMDYLLHALKTIANLVTTFPCCVLQQCLCTLHKCSIGWGWPWQSICTYV